MYCDILHYLLVDKKSHDVTAGRDICPSKAISRRRVFFSSRLPSLIFFAALRTAVEAGVYIISVNDFMGGSVGVESSFLPSFLPALTCLGVYIMASNTLPS